MSDSAFYSTTTLQQQNRFVNKNIHSLPSSLFHSPFSNNLYRRCFHLKIASLLPQEGSSLLSHQLQKKERMMQRKEASITLHLGIRSEHRDAPGGQSLYDEDQLSKTKRRVFVGLEMRGWSLQAIRWIPTFSEIRWATSKPQLLL